MKTLSVIIPYRNRIENLRILLFNLKYVDKTRIEFHLVVMGDSASEIPLLCHDAGVEYHYIADESLFCIGKAHNIGTSFSNAEFIMKQDVDTMPYVGFYDRLLEYIDIHITTRYQYLIIGCYFAGKNYSERELSRTITLDHVNHLKNNKGDRAKFYEHGAEGTMFVMKKEDYISFGGCSDDFSGHGWEDYQVVYCISKLHNPKLHLPDYAPSAIRLFVTLPSNKMAEANDLVLIHRWHEQVDDVNYYRCKERNASVLREKLTFFDNNASTSHV
jgi:predicted glycosyltransferase involved in capsule biosynthesis